MNIRKLLPLLLALSGCTLSLAHDRNADGEYDDVYAADIDTWDDGGASVVSASVTAGARAPATDPTFLPRDAEPVATPPDGSRLRDLTVHMTGMDDDVDRFMKVRVTSRDNRYVAVGVIHQGIPSADYTFELPASLRDDTAYTLSVFADTDGSGGYSAPPDDHAWSMPIPAGRQDVTIELSHDERYTDIERDAPEPGTSLVVSFQDMQEYYKHPLDVRVIERATGRLVGRQLRQVPGDTFDLTIGSVLHEGVQYQVDVAVDIDEDGFYDSIIDDSWRVTGTADSKGLAMTFVPNGPYVDVGF